MRILKQRNRTTDSGATVQELTELLMRIFANPHSVQHATSTVEHALEYLVSREFAALVDGTTDTFVYQ